MLGEWLLRESRIAFWNRLYRGSPAKLEELDRELLSPTRESDDDDKMQFILLRACSAMFAEGSLATRRTLKALLLHGFASGGAGECEECETRLGELREDSDLFQVVDRHLTWQQAYSLVGGNPADYSARSRLCASLKEECQRQWEVVFGSRAPRILSEEEVRV
ncbi:MAG: hypothetical protein AB7V19_07575 [Candidatus Bipolaricaulia bacterium]